MADPAETSVVEVLRLRATLHKRIRAFFDERGFLEVDTPAVVPSPGLDVHLSAFDVRDVDGSHIGWLATSPEYQMKRLLARGADRIYQLGKSFRAEEQGKLHEREFMMLEWYRANASSDDVMHDTETLVHHLATALRSDLSDELCEPWPRLTVAEAIEEYAGAQSVPLAEDEEQFFRVWVEQVQPRLGVEGPVFVTRWPASMASLARLHPDGTADRFEAFYRGVELCNGFGELTDPTEQRARFEADRSKRRALGKPVYPIDERFLEALRAGMPRSGGNALGVDRLLMLLAGADTIQDVMPFPADAL